MPATDRKIIPFQQPDLGLDTVYSIEAEEALIGACLTDPNQFIRCRELVPAPHWFFSLKAAAIWEAMAQAEADGKTPNDLIILQAILTANKKIDEIGGLAYLTQLIAQRAISSARAGEYAGLVRTLYIRRSIAGRAKDLEALALDMAQPVGVLEDRIKQLHATYDLMQDTPIRRAGVEILPGYMDQVDYAHAHPEEVRGVQTGYHDLDNLVGGIPKGKLIAACGYTGMGKTSLLIGLAVQAGQRGFPVAYYNVADSTQSEVTGRMISHLSGVPQDKQVRGLLNAQEHAAYMTGAEKFLQLPIYIEDVFGLTPSRLAAKLRGIRDKKIRLVIVDYYQRMNTEKACKTRFNELEQIAWDLLDVAKTHQLPIIVGAQLGHHIANRSDKRGQIADIADCKRLGQDADLTLMIHREGYWDSLADPHRVELIIRKNRINGKYGTAFGYYRKETGAIENGVNHDSP